MRISRLLYKIIKKHKEKKQAETNPPIKLNHILSPRRESNAELLLKSGYAYKDSDGKIWVRKDIYDNIYPWKGNYNERDHKHN